MSPGSPMIKSTFTRMPAASIACTPRCRAFKFTGRSINAWVRRSTDCSPTSTSVKFACRSRSADSAIDAFSPKLGEIRELPAGVALDEQLQETEKIRPLVERRIQNHHLLRPALGGMPQIGQHPLGRHGVQAIVALRVVAEAALEDAASHRLQEQHALVRRVEDAFQVRRRDLIEPRQRRARQRRRTVGQPPESRNGIGRVGMVRQAQRAIRQTSARPRPAPHSPAILAPGPRHCRP